MDENWLVYVNGETVPMKETKIFVFDRGLQYGEGGLRD
jgi:branched-subunit amino acid aminotransferase/4-amino-4-deoxychorismate lyase